MKTSISIATYNAGLIKAQLAGYTIFEFSPYVELRSRYIAGAVLDVKPDIICLQEIYSRKHLRRIVDSLAATHPYWYAPRSFRPKVFGSGLAIFSRFPILQSAHHWFDSQLPEEAVFAPKAYLAVTIDTGVLGLIEVINSHTTAGGSRHHPESLIADSYRKLQLDELIKFSLQRDMSITHSLLVGDLNCGPEASRDNYEFLMSCGFIDLVMSAHCDTLASITWDPKNPLNVSSPHKTSPAQRIDHILASSRSKLVATGCKYIGQESTVIVSEGISCTPSDHYGVFISINEHDG